MGKDSLYPPLTMPTDCPFPTNQPGVHSGRFPGARCTIVVRCKVRGFQVFPSLKDGWSILDLVQATGEQLFVRGSERRRSLQWRLIPAREYIRFAAVRLSSVDN